MKKVYSTIRLLSVILFALPIAGFSQSTTFNYTGTIVTYIVPAGVSSINVTAAGAQGGGNTGTAVGGLGAIMTGGFTVTPGQVLKILVGQHPTDIITSCGGGGGGSFVWDNATTTLMVAAGGGGGCAAFPDVNGIDATTANNGMNGGEGSGGGTAGSGGVTPAIANYAGGGAGWLSNGNTGYDGGVGCTLAGGGATPLTGGAAGSFGGTLGWDGNGGFGGGGGGQGRCGTVGGGGGGGYSGGGAGGDAFVTFFPGGGGGSFNGGTTVSSSVGNTGDGYVVITNTCVTPVSGAIVGDSIACVGQTTTYTNPTGSPGGTWTASNPAVGTIDPVTGVFLGIGPGTLTITWSLTLTCGSATTSKTVTVNPVPSNITGPGTVCMSNTITLSDATPGGTWSSVTPTVGTVDPSGNVTGITTGSTIISYLVAGCAATTTVTVTGGPGPISGPDSVCVTGTAIYTDPVPGGTWSSIVPGAMTIVGAGTTATATSHALGATNIIYNLGGCQVAKFVTIVDAAAPVTGASQVCKGDVLVLATASSFGVWSSSNTSKATVTPGVFSGLVNTLDSGVVTISYTKPYCPSATHLVTINPLPAPITGLTAICVGLGTVLGDATPGGIWSSSDPSVTVSPTGVVTSATTGSTATIYYTLLTGCYQSTGVNVGTPPPPIVPAKDSACQGGMATLTVADTTHTGIWSSTNLAIAQVIDSSGVVHGISAGTVIISYTMPNGCYRTDSFIVKPLIPASVSITGHTDPVCSGTLDTFVAVPVNGGTPTYFWQKFSFLPVGSGNPLIYAPLHGDVIMCYMVTHGVCSVRDTVVDTMAVNVYPDSMAPVVTIMTTHADSITYVGESITFNTDLTWGGTAPTYQWFVNGKPIGGATNNSFVWAVYEQDTVWCEVTGNPPCPGPPVTGISNGIVIQAKYLGVNGLNTTGSLSLFPNPNNGMFTLSGTVPGREVNYEVTNMLGQVVYKGTAQPVNGRINEQLRPEHIVPGAYLLRVKTETGNETFHFVVEK